MSGNASSEREQRPLDWALTKRLLAYTKPYARTRNALFGLVLLRAIQLPAVTWAIGFVISGPIASGDPASAVFGIVAFVGLVVFTELCFVARMRLALSLGESVVFDMRRQIYAHLLRQPLSFFDKMPLGRLISRVTSDVDVVRIGIQDVVFVSTVQLGSMLIAAALMLYYDALLFFVVCSIVPLLWMVMRYFRARLGQAYRDVQETYSRLTASLAESVNGIRVIQGFVREEHNNEQFQDLIAVHSQNNMAVARYSAVFLPLLEVSGQLFLSLLVVVGGYQALTGALDLSSLIQFLFLSSLFFSPIPILGTQYNQALTAMAGAERVFALLDTPPAFADEPGAHEVRELTGHVEFKDVCLEYVPGRWALDGVSFVALPGETLALVGKTGSGKSSVIRLLAKLYPASSGQVLLDGQPIESLESPSLHRHLASVPQDNTLFSGTVRDNIRFGRPRASDAEVAEVLEQLDVADVIATLPRGLDSEVGEKGANLSMGQRQLVCFARALLANPKILILDEATSAVDAVTEARLNKALTKLLHARTSFVVAHRLSTIRNADRILVLEQGRLVEQGSHVELLARGGAYAALHREFVHGTDSGDAPSATL